MGGMQHCETTALDVLLRHEGLDLSEPMLFGLGYLVDTDQQGGAVVTDLAWLEYDAMRALSRVQP